MDSFLKEMLGYQKQALLAFSLVLILIAPPHIAAAQIGEGEGEESADPAGPVVQLPEPEILPHGLTSCFDFYTYGSVATVPELEILSTVPGATIAVQTTITNENPHPIVDGILYAKVFKKRGGDNLQFGHDLVDQFVARKDLSFQAGESKQVPFEWNVPTAAEGGEYQIAVYFLSAQRFNLAGLTFTDDIIGGTVDFSVVGENEGAVQFDRESVTVNGETHEFATFIPQLEAEDDAVIRATIRNTTNAPYKGMVAWTLYGWDGMRIETVIDERSEEVELHPDGEQEVLYTAKGLNRLYPVYYLVGELTHNDAKSVIDVRYSHRRPDAQWARFNDVGISKEYPTKAGDSAYVCFQAFSGMPNDNPTGTVNIQVTEPGVLSGKKIVAESTYRGILPYEFAALPVVIPKRLTTFTISAALYVGDVLIDTVDMEYSCEALAGDACQKKSNTPGILLLTGAIVIVIGAFAAYKIRRYSGDNDTRKPIIPSNTPDS